MPILKPLQFLKAIQYNTIIEDEICFTDSMSSVIKTLGKSESTKESDNQTTLEYKRNLHTFISTAYYCFVQEKLYSVCYEIDALTDDESEHFLSDMKRLISESPFDGVMNYVCCAKEYWELSDGEVSARICLYAKNNKTHIRIDYFD